MKKLIFLLFILFLLNSHATLAQCDCSWYVNIQNFSLDDYKILKTHKARWKKNTNKAIYYTLDLEKNVKYFFKIYNKKGKLINNIKVTFISAKREVLLENVDSIGKVESEFIFCPLKEGLYYMDVSVVSPETNHCTCAYIIMFIYDK